MDTNLVSRRPASARTRRARDDETIRATPRPAASARAGSRAETRGTPSSIDHRERRERRATHRAPSRTNPPPRSTVASTRVVASSRRPARPARVHLEPRRRGMDDRSIDRRFTTRATSTHHHRPRGHHPPFPLCASRPSIVDFIDVETRKLARARRRIDSKIVPLARATCPTDRVEDAGCVLCAREAHLCGIRMAPCVRLFIPLSCVSLNTYTCLVHKVVFNL